MNTDEVLDVFREAGALLEGHFILSSGRRSPVFLQKALIFKNPRLTEIVCKALAAKVKAAGIEPDVIIAPAMGGVIPGYETARHMGIDSLFVERVDGVFTLRRGFSIAPGSKVLMVEDIVTTVQQLCESEKIPLNMEMAATEEMLEIALDLRPKAVCIVPERREERTTEGGLDVAGGHNHIAPIVRALAENGSRVSLFIEAVEEQIRAAANTGAAVVEFHTGAYALAYDDGKQDATAEYIEVFKKAAALADSLGLEVHFGHGLTYGNVGKIAAIPECMELNIGHFIIGEAIFSGLEAAVAEMRNVVADARQA